LDVPSITQIIKEGGTVIILKEEDTSLSVSIIGDPTSLTNGTAHSMVKAYMYGDEYNNELFRIEPQGNA